MKFSEILICCITGSMIFANNTGQSDFRHRCRFSRLFVSPFLVLRWFSQLWRMFPFACIRLCSPFGREGTPSLFLRRELLGVPQLATWAWDSIHSPPVTFSALGAVRARSPLVALNHSEPLAPGGYPHRGIHGPHTEKSKRY